MFQLKTVLFLTVKITVKKASIVKNLMINLKEAKAGKTEGRPVKFDTFDLKRFKISSLKSIKSSYCISSRF